MENENILKIREFLKTGKKFALILQEKLSIDELCSAVALHDFLIKEGKTVQIFSSTEHLPELSFLGELPKIHTLFGKENELIIKVLARTSKPKALRYEKDGEDLTIYISGQNGQIPEQDVVVTGAITDFDAFIMMGVKVYEKLGLLHEKSPEVLHNRTKVVISNLIDQEYYGAINWVEPNILSMSEMVAMLLDDRLSSMNSTRTMTALLTGIIARTQSFRDPRTTPQTLSLAARLVKLGAEQQRIIQHLFKTKSFNLLLLWGRSLARVKSIPDSHVLYSVLTKQDFEKSQTTIEIVPEVLSELASLANDYQLLVLGVEHQNGMQIFIAGPPHVKLRKLASELSPDHNQTPEPLLGNYHFVSVFLPDKTTEEISEVTQTLVDSI